jgi:hypothetical protein
MSSYLKFLTIYKSTLIQGPYQKIIADPVTIEFIKKESRSYKVQNQVASVAPSGEIFMLAKDTTLSLDKNNNYIVITARIKEKNTMFARKICEDETDKIITILSSIYTSTIFGDLFYRGWKIEENEKIMDAWVKVADKRAINEELLTAEIKKIKKTQFSNPEIRDRFTLLSRFFSKSLPFHPCEEKFILLWTILEIFPMKNTSNIKPLIYHLAAITGKDFDTIKENLGIGKLYGLRCDLIHNGKLGIGIKDMGVIFAKLEDIIFEVLRNMCGLPYSGSLDRFF